MLMFLFYEKRKNYIVRYTGQNKEKVI